MAAEGIILAAGLSSRAGTYKLALRLDGKSILENCIESMYDSCSKLIVVGGHNYDVVEQLCSKYSKVKLIFNRNFKDGMFSSIKEGLKFIGEEKFFLIPGDYPTVKKETYSRLLREDGDLIIPAYNGRKGHPILIKSYLKGDILNSKEYTSLRDFVYSQRFTIVNVDDPGILFDIDTIEDYEQIKGKLNGIT